MRAHRVAFLDMACACVADARPAIAEDMVRHT